MSLIQPRAFAFASREGLVEKRGVDDADYGLVVHDEGDGDAEHWEEVGIVDGA